MELSYTQNMEDYHLWLALGGKPDGFYIDVGAGHPVADNVSMWFYERGWRGIVVEPQGELLALYPRLRPRDIAVGELIGRTTGTAQFHAVDRLHGFSTTVQQHAEGSKAFGAGYRTLAMPMITLADLCARHGVDVIDFLKIDVEGAEADVLAGNDWKRFRPKVVVAEAIEPGTNAPNWEPWDGFLRTQGYTFVLFDTLNRFYVANEARDVLERAPRERADWGLVRHMYEIGRAGITAEHPDHVLARDLARGLWADLPNIEPAELARLIGRTRGLDDVAVAALAAELSTDAGRLRLGRIACGYDGGQIWED